MGIRFQKKVKTSGSSWLNLSKSGVSLSIGGKGKTVNIGSRGVTTSLRIPGTNISFRNTFSGKRKAKANRISPERVAQLCEGVTHHSSISTERVDYRQKKKQIGHLYQWRVVMWIAAIFLICGFLMGGNPDWSIGVLVLAIIGNILINRSIKKFEKK